MQSNQREDASVEPADDYFKGMKLDRKMVELVAVGASLAVNCQDCLKYHGHKAAEVGADEDEIVEAVKIGMMVRAGAASTMNGFVRRMARANNCSKLDNDPFVRQEVTENCGCE